MTALPPFDGPRPRPLAAGGAGAGPAPGAPGSSVYGPRAMSRSELAPAGSAPAPVADSPPSADRPALGGEIPIHGASGGAPAPPALGGGGSLASAALGGPPPPRAGGASPAAPPPDGALEPLNLARRPFINSRPVVRAATILWLAGLLLLAANVALFMGYLADSQETRSTLAGLQRTAEREQSDVAALDGSIGRLGLEQQNRMVAYLNRMIEERTFSWSLLFDRMAEVLPKEVRLLRLSPSGVAQKDIDAALRAGREVKQQPITLVMSCEAKSDEAMLRFVDNLFAHPAFAEPNLVSEQREDNGLVRFELNVQYQPNLANREVEGAAAAADASTSPSRATSGRGRSAARAGSPAGVDLPAAAAAGPDEGGGATAARPSLPASAGLVRVAPPAEPAPGARRGAVRPLPRRPAASARRSPGGAGGGER